MDYLQEPFLDLLFKEEMLVYIYLINGIKLQGKIKAFDGGFILLNNEGTDQMVFKHSIATVVLTRKIDWQEKIVCHTNRTVEATKSEDIKVT